MRVRRARSRVRILRRRFRPHDMFEPTDYDFPDDHEVEDWMIAAASEAK